MKLRGFGLRLLQGFSLMLVAYLFVCLMTANVSQSPLSFELPTLVEPDSSSTLELLLFSVPGQLLFLLTGSFIHRRRVLIGVYAGAASITLLLQCLLFAETFGSTWSRAEIAGLLAFNLPSGLIALAPGLALVCALEYLSRARQSHNCE